jgi:NAD/NADP transhydrogenase alpha subunit
MQRWLFTKRRALIAALLCFSAIVAAIGNLTTPRVARASKVDAAPAAEKLSQETAPAKTEAEKPFPLVESLFILMLAGFLGFEVITRVSPLLHTPLMAATNAISGISLVGSLVIAGNSNHEFPGLASQMLGFVAVTAAMINVVGGFMITDRMLKMFKKKGAGR